MKAIVAARFAPLNFADVNGFPNLVLAMDIWGYCLPRFRESKGDNPSDHLIRFHQCMFQLEICHEDVLMKMFVFSLEGDAREWYRSLLPTSISSLKEFYRVFHHRCERYYPRDILLEGCCEDEILFTPTVQEEDLQDRVDENIDEDYVVDEELLHTINCEDCMVVDASSHIFDAYAAFDLHEGLIL